MLSVAKHPHWIPHCVRNDIVCHAERSVAQWSIHTGFLTAFGMTPRLSCWTERKRSEASILDSSLSLGMTKKSARNDKKRALGMTKKSTWNDKKVHSTSVFWNMKKTIVEKCRKPTRSSCQHDRSNASAWHNAWKKHKLTQKWSVISITLCLNYFRYLALFPCKCISVHKCA